MGDTVVRQRADRAFLNQVIHDPQTALAREMAHFKMMIAAGFLLTYNGKKQKQ
ncbi:hypothetical protein LJN55_04810 [Erwinia rhapontici]|uniref:hypothetical protein n=1 Tax=Erwinia rhapontici TaxID=55212 RepID=UPI001D0D844A|nr:hypothetical protein [Erwinia rhapontici]UDQ81185.1 hypothetical protein LJN55_04810 [Erwinia rhapontici]